MHVYVCISTNEWYLQTHTEPNICIFPHWCRYWSTLLLLTWRHTRGACLTQPVHRAASNFAGTVCLTFQELFAFHINVSMWVFVYVYACVGVLCLYLYRRQRSLANRVNFYSYFCIWLNKYLCIATYLYCVTIVSSGWS